jgi:hypothetical protein
MSSSRGAAIDISSRLTHLFFFSFYYCKAETSIMLCSTKMVISFAMRTFKVSTNSWFEQKRTSNVAIGIL